MSSLLFENLQTMNEASKLEERKALSVSEYNKLKLALNKHNVMKANFILHPGDIEVNDYKLRIKVYGAFRSFEQTRDSYYAYSSHELTNDQATQRGVGVHLYNVYVNLIDETVKFDEARRSWELDNYLNRYEQQLINSDSIAKGEINVESIKNTIADVIANSKVDLEQTLSSKNFIYNLTGRAKTEPSYSSKYNLDLDVENASLTEDFDPSMPNWLMRSIKMNNVQRNSDHKDVNYTMPLDTMKWEVEPFPEKGKLGDIADSQYIALLIDKSGDEHRGQYIIYFPAAYIGNHETIYINGRNRRIDSMSLKALAPYIKEYAHTVDFVTDVTNVRQKQMDRATAQDGMVNRKPDANDWWSRDKRDKSGYIVDPNKYKRLLAQNKQDKYSDRLNDLYLVLSDVRNTLKDYMSSDDTIPTAGKKDYGRDNKFNKGSRAYKEYSAALAEYGDALADLDNIASGKKDMWGESFESFERAVKNAEKYIVNCLTILEN